MSAGESVGPKCPPKSVKLFAGLGPNSDFNFNARVRQSPVSVGRTSGGLSDRGKSSLDKRSFVILFYLGLSKGN